MSRVYIEMDTIHPVEDEECGIYVPPTGSCDDCTAFEQRLEDVEAELPNKQDALTAGTGIDITSNVISSTVLPANTAPLMDGTAAVGTSTRYARQDHVHPKDTAKQDKAVPVQVTIASTDWSGTTATKTVSGVTSSNNVIVTYAPASKTAYTTADIYASAQGTNSLTFTCTTAPSVSVTANVLIFD